MVSIKVLFALSRFSLFLPLEQFEYLTPIAQIAEVETAREEEEERREEQGQPETIDPFRATTSLLLLQCHH